MCKLKMKMMNVTKKLLMQNCKNAIRSCKLETILVDVFSMVCKGMILNDECVWPNATVNDAYETHACRWIFKTMQIKFATKVNIINILFWILFQK